MHQRSTQQSDCFRSGLIGCGAIGSGLDESNGSSVLTHAAAYAATPGVELVAICDSDQERLKNCGQYRGVQSQYHDFKQMLASEPLDIVSICTPVSERLDVIKAAVESETKVILCEKPLAPSLAEAQAIAKIIGNSDSTLAVNFQRRWDPGIQQAARLVQTDQLGHIQRGIAIYEKGMSLNGTHLIDLLNLFLGSPSEVQAVPRSTMEPADPYTPTFDAQLRYTNDTQESLIYVVSLDYSPYSIFELHLLGTKGRIVMTNGGQDLTVFNVVRDAMYEEYKALAPCQKIQTCFDKHLLLVIQEMIDICRGTCKSPTCGLEEGLENSTVVDRLLASHGNGVSHSMGHA